MCRFHGFCSLVDDSNPDGSTLYDHKLSDGVLQVVSCLDLNARESRRFFLLDDSEEGAEEADPGPDLNPLILSGPPAPLQLSDRKEAALRYLGLVTKVCAAGECIHTISI